MPLVFLLIFTTIGLIDGVEECLSGRGNRKFFKIRDCARSPAPVVAFANYRNLNRCLGYASSRNGLAVNFSPSDAGQFRGESFHAACQVLACPEIVESNLVNDSAYDYYSFYRNLSDELTCVRSVGVYRLFQEKANYTQAVKTCQSLNGDLAQVQSEVLTNSLATLISNSIRTWAKAAFIGMDDMRKRGDFATPFGNRLSCYKYRAWAPGHPRLVNRRHCVVLDEGKMWRATSCRNQMPFLCEIYPNVPLKVKQSLDCSTITEKGKMQECERRKKLRREDMCSII